MGRRANTSYIVPLKSDGTLETQNATADTELGRGSYTLASGTTYYYILPAGDGTQISAHFIWDASIVITSLTVETCDFPVGPVNSDVADHDASTEGKWIDEDPSTAYVGTKGAGVTVTNGVVAVAGGAKGGCRFNLADFGGRRARIAVVVGATGGEVMCACSAKD